MKRFASFFLMIALMLVTTACPAPEQDARDASAALGGLITSAQNQYLTSCQVDKTQSVCVKINKAAAVQGALITAIEAYCGWSQTPPPDQTATCVPVKSAQSALTSATNNANFFITELKAILSSPPPTPAKGGAL